MADRFACSVAHRHFLFLAATFCTIFFMGYHFGTYDQASHIPFLRKFADPSLYPNDSYLELRLTHYSYFWFLFLPFYNLGVLEISMFLVHVLATYTTFWSLWVLSNTLFHNSLAAFLSILIFVFPHMTFGGWTIFEFSLLNRTFVLPFLLFGIILFLKRRYLFAFALVGLMFDLHVISANFVMAMFLLHALISWRKVGWRNLALSVLIFVILALPVLIWKATGPQTDLELRPDALSLLALALISNNFYLLAPQPHILLATASGFSTLVLFFIARKNMRRGEHDSVIVHFVYAAILILLVEIATAQWLPLAIIIELQIIRVGILVLIFGLLYFANYLAECYQSSQKSSRNVHGLTAAGIFSLFVFVPLVIWSAQRVIAIRWRIKAASFILIGMTVSTYAYAASLNVWYPGIYVFPHKTNWYDAQIWARDHTPKDTVFIAPPYKWWSYESEWRVFSERSMVAALSDLLEGSIMLKYLDVWKPRFEAVAPGALLRFRGDLFENGEITARAYDNLSAEDFMRIARHYGASYLVLEKPYARDFPIVYENQGFTIYRLPLSVSRQ